MTVPMRPNRSYVNPITVDPLKLVMKMATGSAFNGARPRTAALVADDVDPAVSAGRLFWDELTEGGLFDLLGNQKRALVLESVELDGTTFTIVDSSGNTLRAGPSTFPAKVFPGEYLKFTGGSNGAQVEVVARRDGTKIL
jgi:hypothetical protein